MLRNAFEWFAGHQRLSAEEFFSAWEASTKREETARGPNKESVEATAIKNFLVIRELERRQPGSVAYLTKEHGIHDFARYPIELLAGQYIERDNTDLPYGTIFFPQSDWNGAFYEKSDVLGNLHDQLRGKYLIRISEQESKNRVVRQLVKFRRKYGKHHKISFALVGGHGTADSIQFGDQLTRRGILKKEDLKNSGRSLLEKRKFFEDNPTLILMSCSTGAEFGIGDFMARSLHATVIAPEKVAYGTKKIGVEIKDGKPVFSVEYGKTATRVFRG